MQKYSKIINRKIRFALVGCGRISANHFHSMKLHHENIDLVDVCDTDGDALAKAVNTTGANGYTNMTDMLRASTADVIVLTTPSGLHSAQTIQAAHAGKHIVTEKPMATSWNDGLRMVRACDEAGVRLFVVKQNRRNATLQLLRRAIEQKRFGRIHNVAINVFWTRPQSYYDQGGGWRGKWEYDGGAFMNQASHYIDLLDWLIGPVDSVMSYTATQARNIEAEDTGVAIIKWRSGAIGTLNVSMLTYPQNLEGSITILGENGSAKVGGVAVNEILEWKFSEIYPEDAEIQKANYATASVYGIGHPLYYENVIQALRGEAAAETDGRAGLKSLELLVAMYHSAKSGVKVSLPLER